MTPIQLISRFGVEHYAAQLDCSAFPQITMLKEKGADLIEHSLGSFSEHLHRTASLLQSWGATREVSLGGLFHSAYGSPYNSVYLFEENERELVKLAIGSDAENLAFVYSALDRKVLYQCSGWEEVSGLEPAVDPCELEQLVQIDLANVVDQAVAPDRSPGIWISRWSVVARRFRHIHLPIFEALRQINISKSQEEEAIAAYVDALKEELPLSITTFDRLCEAAAALALPGEPLVVAAAHLHENGDFHKARILATEAVRRIGVLSTPWDKRASSESWLALAKAFIKITQLRDRRICP